MTSDVVVSRSSSPVHHTSAVIRNVVVQRETCDMVMIQDFAETLKTLLTSMPSSHPAVLFCIDNVHILLDRSCLRSSCLEPY